jgi:biopolymer transport protein ExbD
MRRKKRAGQDEAGIDLTPMLDIVFIMLIFFIVTATFIREVGIDILRPDQDAQQQARTQPIVIRVTELNEIWMGDRTVTMDAVRANVERERAERPDAPVIIQAHPDAEAGITVGILDRSRLAGATAVTIAAEQR